MFSLLLNSDTWLSARSSPFFRTHKPDLDPKESVKAEEPVLPKKPPKEQRVIKEMHFITTDEFNGVPA